MERLTVLGLNPGDYLHVPPHTTLIVDTVSVDLGGMFVEGEVIFDSAVAQTELRSSWILVGTSLSQYPCRITIGSQSVPWPQTSTATITLLGAFSGKKDPADPDQDPNTPSPASLLTTSPQNVEAWLEDGGLVVFEHGALRAFGAEYGAPWVELAATTSTSSPVITVDTSLGVDVGPWAGKPVVVVSSDYAVYGTRPVQDQVTTVIQVAANGLDQADLQLPAPLNQIHYALDYTPAGRVGQPGWTVRERAEVALLERNVVIRAEKDHNAQWVPGDGTHGHVILARDDGEALPTARLSWVEFRNLGVEGKIRRYPLHYHMVGDQGQLGSPSFVLDCLFDDCFNKFLSIHDTKNMVVSGNVGYGTIGNGFFLEDREAQGIELTGNLGLGVRAIDPQKRHTTEPVGTEDVTPAVFWHVSPLNKIEKNHAAGSTHHGFWYAPIGGEAAKVDGATSYFRENVAHSNGHHGFFEECLGAGLRAEPWYDPANDPAQWKDCVSWKNRRYGFWVRSYGDLWLSGLHAADNRAGFYLASDGFQDVAPGPGTSLRCTSRIQLVESLVIGETTNVGEFPQPGATSDRLHEEAAGRSLPQVEIKRDGNRLLETTWAALTGVEIYDGLVVVDDLHCGDMQDISLPPPSGGTAVLRLGAGITQVAYESQYMADPRNRFRLCDFEAVDHRVFFRDPASAGSPANMIRYTVAFDEDGSLTSPSLGPGYLVPSSQSFLVEGVTNTELAADQVRHVADAEADFASLEVVASQGTVQPAWVGLQHTIFDGGGWTGAMTFVHEATGTQQYPVTLRLGDNATDEFREYQLEWLTENKQLLLQADRPQVVRLNLRFAKQEDDAMVVAVPWWRASKPGTITVNDVSLSPGQGSLADLRSATATDYFWDASNSTLYLKIIAKLIQPGSIGLLETGTEQECKIEG